MINPLDPASGLPTDFLLNLAAGFTQSLLTAGAARLKQAALGTDEERALKAALAQGFAALLAEVESQIPDGALREEHTALVRTIFDTFIGQPDVAENLLALALAGTPPDLALLARRFNQLDFDRETLAVDFNQMLIAYHQRLAAALVAEASQEGGSLFNRVSLGRTLSIQALLLGQRRSLAQISATIARLEQLGPQTFYNIVIEQNLGPLAIGNQAQVTQSTLPVDVQALLAEVLALLRTLRPDPTPPRLHKPI